MELRLSTFEEAVNILKKPSDNTNGEALFELVERIKIPYNEYSDYLENQKIANINSNFYLALLN
jgi:transcription elongation factor GreA-like protein